MNDCSFLLGVYKIMQKTSRLQFLGPNGHSLICVIIASGIFGICVGMVMPLLPLRLNSWGTSELWIGVNALSSSMAILLVAPAISGLVSRIGIANTVYLGILCFALSVVGLGLYNDIYIWFGLRLILGFGIALLWIGMELWVNAAAPDHLRGRVLAVYAGVFAGFTATGPIVLNFVGINGFVPFLIIAIAAMVSMIPIFLGKNTAPQFKGNIHVSIKSVIFLAPILMVVGVMAGLGDGSAWSLLALFGVKAGLSESAAILTTSMHLAGAVVCQIPIGYLTDKMSRSWLLVIMAVGGLLATIIIWAVESNSIIFWVALFLNGGVLMGLYTISLAIIGSRFAGSGMASANAAFIMCFELGIMMGAPASGVAMEWAGAEGLLYVIGGSCIVVLLAMPFHFVRKAKRKLSI